MNKQAESVENTSAAVVPEAITEILSVTPDTTGTEDVISNVIEVVEEEVPVVEVVSEPAVKAEVVPTPIPPAVEKENISLLGKIAQQNLLDYITNMAPRKPVTVEEGTRHQVQLYRTLTNIINNLDDDFNYVFANTLQLFHEHKDGVFHECRVFRHFESIPLSKDERASFQRILNLLKLTADPKGRQLAVKQASIANTLKFVSEKGIQKVTAFYSR